MMSNLRNQEGMTLPEVLIAMVIGLIVSGATFTLVQTVMVRTGDIAARVDTTQRSRAAMDFITRQLRSQVCVQATTPLMADERLVFAATPTSITFFSDLGDESFRTGNTPGPPELRSLSLLSGKLVENRYVGVQNLNTDANPTYNYSGYPNSPTQTRVLVDDVSTVETTSTGQPLIFRYFQFGAPVGTSGARPDLGWPTPADAPTSLIARIEISYRANRSRGKATDRGSTVLENSVFVRNADPNATTPKPVCA